MDGDMLMENFLKEYLLEEVMAYLQLKKLQNH